MPEFQVLANDPTPTVGLVLRVGTEPHRYFRLTHVFRTCVYGMWVGNPDAARYARRPRAISPEDLRALAASPAAVWGRLVLPPALSTEPKAGSDKAALLDSAWGIVQPLIQAFQRESNLSRQSFTALVRQRAEETESSPSTVLRSLLRYYYFGGTRLALLPLPPGVKPGHAAYASDADATRPAPRRRGRQSAMARELGGNQFIVRSEDIQDMVDCFRRLLAKGPTFKTMAHEEYLGREFRTRHKALYDRYAAGEVPEPVTSRQFRTYIDEHLRVTEELARNLRTYTRNPGFMGNVRAAGPGEIYEIDATGGRLLLVSSVEPPVVVGTPTIYLLIDRWSRYIVSAYISLRPASYEEVRHVLLVAFTSREARFNRLGINVTDERWPVGPVPAVICPDRGSDFMSESMEQSVVNDLRIDLTPLPPLCPDGKAVVERLIREIKRRMAASGIEGVYADRPMDPRTKRAARKAAAAAVRTLSEAYRLLVEIVVDHNNRPHSTLRRRRVLTQAGVQPTPREAYLWGLRHITGLRSAPFSEDDYHRLLLSTDKASLANGVLSYKNRPYLPDNEPAAELALHSTRRPRRVDVRLDKTMPTQVLIPNAQGTWARFKMSDGVANEIAGVSLDEEEAMSGHTALLWARAEHEGRVARVTAKVAKRTSSGKADAKGPATSRTQATKRRPPAAQLPRAEQTAARNIETANMKAKLHGTPAIPSTDADLQEAVSTPDWIRVEEEERQRNLALIRKHRNRR